VLPVKPKEKQMTAREELVKAVEDARDAYDAAYSGATWVAFSDASAALCAYDMEIQKNNEMQKIWESLRAIYGSDLQAATVTVLVKDGETAVRFITTNFPLKEENT
jgi:N-acyl-D-aspartate/D-glutamate deacylase